MMLIDVVPAVAPRRRQPHSRQGCAALGRSRPFAHLPGGRRADGAGRRGTGVTWRGQGRPCRHLRPQRDGLPDGDVRDVAARSDLGARQPAVRRHAGLLRQRRPAEGAHLHRRSPRHDRSTPGEPGERRALRVHGRTAGWRSRVDRAARRRAAGTPGHDRRHRRRASLVHVRHLGSAQGRLPRPRTDQPSHTLHRRAAAADALPTSASARRRCRRRTSWSPTCSLRCTSEALCAS